MITNQIKKKTIILICFLVLIINILPTSSSTFLTTKKIKDLTQINRENWSMFRHDLTHTGYSPSFAPNTNTTIWSYYPPENNIWLGDSSPTIVDGRLYIGACTDIIVPTTGYVYCLDEYSGELIWTRKTEGWIESSPAVSDNKVYVGSLYFGLFFNGTVYCLNSANGKIIWSYKTSYKVYSSPAVANQKVYFGSTDLDLYNSKGEIVCLDANNGDLIWKYIPDKGILSSPAIYNDRVYVGSMDNKVYCLNAENGELIWNYTTNGRIRSSPTIYDNKVYIGSINRRLYCLDAENGYEFWNYSTDGDIGASPAVGYGNVYIGTHYNSQSNNASFYCLDALNGTQIWNFTTALSIVSSASIGDYKLYLGFGGSFNTSGKICCLNVSNGEYIWDYKTNLPVMSSPAICNNKLYINEYEGYLYCFCDNNAPYTPSRPLGKGVIKPQISYNYSTVADDPDDGQIRYGWDWDGDKEIDEWTDYYYSGETITTSHIWEKKGINFVRVRCEDLQGLQSSWSKPLPILVSKEKSSFVFLQNLFEHFPIILKILSGFSS